jgi:hypothetical protein
MAQINPFQGPINYSVDVQSPFEAAIGGFKIGQAGAEMQAQAQAREQKQKFQTGLSDFFKKTDRTYEDLEKLLPFADKQQFDALTKVGEGMEKRKLDTEKRFSAQTLLALESDPTVAKTMLQERFEAEKDPNQKRALQAYIKTIDVSPQKAAELIELTGATTFGKDWYQGITEAREERRKAALAPSALMEAKAKADKAVQEASNAVLTAEDDIAKARAERLLKEAEANAKGVEARYAEQAAKDAIKKRAADLGLTTAQTNQALATTRKLGTETQKIALELEGLKATGGLDPVKSFEQEEKLRKEFQTRTKNYGELGTTFSNIQSSAKSNTGAGDIALITGFMKMLDPTSVVRETEFATGRDTAGLYARLENNLQKAQNGQFLQPKQREEYVTLAKQYLDSAQKKAGEDKKALGVVVKNYRLNPDNVFGPEDVGGGAGRGSVNPVVITLPNGQSATFSSQQQADAFKKAAGL